MMKRNTEGGGGVGEFRYRELRESNSAAKYN